MFPDDGTARRAREGVTPVETPIYMLLGCDVPIFAFSHRRDALVAVTKAGGFGVLGAFTYSPEQLETELGWIDEHNGGRPDGVDVLIPTAYDTRAEAAPGDLGQMTPGPHRAFMDRILERAGIPELADEDRTRFRAEVAASRGGMTPDGARRLVGVALKHPQITLVVTALGAPPDDVIADLNARDVVVGAMCGKSKHAERQITGGVQVIVAQGTEAIWLAPGTGYLPTPLQDVLYNEAHQRVVRAQRKKLHSFPVGQSVGAVTSETSIADVMYRLQMEYGEAMERLVGLT